MRKAITIGAGLVLVLAVSASQAQMRPTAPAESSPGQPAAGTHAPGHQPQQSMTGRGMMTMMCPMMGQSMMGMGPGMMGGGMTSGTMGTSDPKAQARMLKLRGEMMKAMGDVLLKHAQEIEQGQ
jgi:hypothetical protein